MASRISEGRFALEWQEVREKEYGKKLEFIATKLVSESTYYVEDTFHGSLPVVERIESEGVTARS